MKNFLNKLSSAYNSLPPSQRKVAEYVFHHLNDAILSNTMQIAKKAGVSEATVIRCVNSLGFASFSEFKRIIGQKVLEGASTSRRLIDSSETLESSPSLFLDIISGDIEKIGELNRKISEKTFQQAVDKLCGARNLYVLGLRSSYALAFYLAFDLRFFLDSVRLIELGVGDLPEQVRDITPSDVLVTISFKRYTRKTVDITEMIKKKGAYIIAITNSELSPIAQISDLALIADTKIPAYFESYTAPMSLLNAMITAIAVKHKDKAIPMLDRLETEFENFNTFIQ